MDYNNCIDKSYKWDVEQKKPDAKEYTLDNFVSMRDENRKRTCAVRSQESGYILGGTGRGTRAASGWLGMAWFLLSVLIHGCVLLRRFGRPYPYELCASLNSCSGGWGVGELGEREPALPSVAYSCALSFSQF